MTINSYKKIVIFCNFNNMELSVNQIIATILSLIVILKLLIIPIFPKSMYEKFLKIYSNSSTLNTIYYIYTFFGTILFYFIYTSSQFLLADIFALSVAFNFIVGGAMIKIFGKQFAISDVMKNPLSMYKSLWLYMLIWLLLSVMTLKEIFFN